MAYLVSGATGFIGRRLVERLLSQHPGVSIHVLTRPASLPQLERLIERWGEVDPTASDRIRPLLGDLTEPRLGVDEETVAALRRDDIEHFFHLAAVYDMNADLETDHRVNVEGTRHAVELATVVDAGCLHHMSSIAVAGDYHGVFTEEMLDVGQPLRHPYHLTKFEAEQIVRRGSITPWRIYRPAIVVGDSRTGAIDKADGPYYFFPLIKRAGERLPGWVPLVGPELGHTNVVPVDFVVAAIDHIAHRPGLDGQTFHLANPTRQRVVDLVNALAQGSPRPSGRSPDQRRTADGRSEGRAVAAGAGPRRPGRGAAGAGRGRHPRAGGLLHGPARRVRHAERYGSARGIRDRGTRTRELRRRALALLGAELGPRPLSHLELP